MNWTMGIFVKIVKFSIIVHIYRQIVTFPYDITTITNYKHKSIHRDHLVLIHTLVRFAVSMPSLHPCWDVSGSVDFAKLLLFSTISSIVYLRGFFRESNFEDALISDNKSNQSVKFKILKRGISSQADDFLDYLVPPLNTEMR